MASMSLTLAPARGKHVKIAHWGESYLKIKSPFCAWFFFPEDSTVFFPASMAKGVKLSVPAELSLV